MTHRTLLLTPWYFPIEIIPWQAAAKLKYEQTVNVVVEHDTEISSPSVTWRIPAVIRLKKLARKFTRGAKYSRLAVYERDGFCCQYCGARKSFSELTRDHVVPRSQGGRTSFENTVAACKPCDSRKGDLSCDEAGMWPLHAPRRPEQLTFGAPRFGEDVPAEWAGFTAGS